MGIRDNLDANLAEDEKKVRMHHLSKQRKIMRFDKNLHKWRMGGDARFLDMTQPSSNSQCSHATCVERERERERELSLSLFVCV